MVIVPVEVARRASAMVLSRVIGGSGLEVAMLYGLAGALTTLPWRGRVDGSRE